MHKSRLAGFIIDCQNHDLEPSARFWSQALGMKPLETEEKYIPLDAGVRDLHIEVQRVEHASRLHLDIESTDVPAEVARLERLGAKQINALHTWIVMEAPTGQRFCVVRAKNLGAPGFNDWP